MFSFAVVLWTICTQEVPIRGHLRTLRVRSPPAISLAACRIGCAVLCAVVVLCMVVML